MAGIVIVVLLVARRVTLKTYIPFGPFLILGALWAILAAGPDGPAPGQASDVRAVLMPGKPESSRVCPGDGANRRA